MPASKKDLRAQKQKANIKAGIGDEKGRLPSQTKVVTRQLLRRLCEISWYCTYTASELPWRITLLRMPLWWQAALCASSRSGWSRKMNRFFLNWEETMRGGRASGWIGSSFNSSAGKTALAWSGLGPLFHLQRSRLNLAEMRAREGALRRENGEPAVV